MEKIHIESQQANYLKEYQEIKKYLTLIQELGQDTSRIKLEIAKINEDLENELNQVYRDDTGDQLKNPIEAERIKWSYLNAITKLSKIKEMLIKEYDIDIAINSSVEELENNINNTMEENLNTTIELLSHTINLISSISNDNNIDKSLLDKIYSMTYQLIKLELIYTNNSTLLNTILESEVTTINVEKYLLKEIQSLDLTDPKNEAIRKRYNELKTMTLKNNFLDYELLNLLKFYHNEKYLSVLKKELSNKSTSLEQQRNEIEKKTERKRILQQEIKKTKLSRKGAKRNIIRYRTFITAQAIFVLTTFLGAGVLSKKIATLKYIPSYTTTYHVNKDKITTKRTEQWMVWGSSYEDNRVLQQYNPWYDKETEEDGYLSHDYYQEIVTYDLNSIYYDNIKEYANINLEDYTPSITEEKSEYLMTEDLYHEPQYIITEIYYDKENIYSKLNKILFVILLVVSELLITCMDLCLYILINSNERDKKYEKTCKKFQINQEKLLKLEKELSEITQSLSLLTSNYEALQNEISRDLKYLPESLSSNQELHKTRKRIKESSTS